MMALASILKRVSATGFLCPVTCLMSQVNCEKSRGVELGMESAYLAWSISCKLRACGQ